MGLIYILRKHIYIAKICAVTCMYVYTLNSSIATPSFCVFSTISTFSLTNILHEIRKRKDNWIGHILRRNCLLKHVIKGKIKGEMEVTKRRGRKRKKLLDDLKERRGYCHLKEEALDRTVWRNRFRGGFGPVVRQNTE